MGERNGDAHIDIDEGAEKAPLMSSPRPGLQVQPTAYQALNVDTRTRSWRKLHKIPMPPNSTNYSPPASITNPFRQHDSNHPFSGHGASQALLGNISSTKMRRELVTIANDLYFQNRNSQGELNDRINHQELLAGLLFPGEEVISIPPLALAEVQFEGQEMFKVSAIQTNLRLILMKVDAANVSTFQKKENKETFLRETYVIANTLLDGVWYYPIPMGNLTGISFDIKSEDAEYCRLERRRPWWALLICIFGLLLGLLYFLPNVGGLSVLFVISPAVAALVLLGALLFLVINTSSRSSHSWHHSIKSRIVKIGFSDPLTQKHTVATCALENTYSLQDLKYFIAMLQRNATQMSGFIQPTL